ncbi:MAG: cytochrome c oxidase assembly protein [Actinomycetota bacterium]|nr:cytochrome c oxidase assembly protein [Acidimicrobiia bacterium]MDQ3293078.1 cytochrome c oxidase assembly protein [Actinomycetota bacterium]
MLPFQAHPEVWVLVVGLVALAGYAAKVVGPKAVRDGGPIVTRRQTMWFGLGMVVLWLASDWPVHDIAEERLYSVHMAQHLLLSYVAAPLFLLATPTWLARLLVRGTWVRFLVRPIVAGVLYNVVIVFLHWQNVVNGSVQSPVVHYSLHVLLMAASLLVWMPVCGPLPEHRISLPAQMIYLFLMSIVPTIPAAWLTFAEGVVYSAYDIPERLWGLSVTTDQQLAGLLMKLVAGMYLWGLIGVLFVRWASRNQKAEKAGRTLSEREILTWDDVKDELTPTATP